MEAIRGDEHKKPSKQLKFLGWPLLLVSSASSISMLRFQNSKDITGSKIVGGKSEDGTFRSCPLRGIPPLVLLQPVWCEIKAFVEGQMTS